MTKKRRYLATVVCILVGFVLLTGSAYANYDNANGYNLYKNGLKKFLYAENFSMDAEMSLSYNGQVLETARTTLKYDRNGDPSEYTKNSQHSYTDETWIQDGQRVYRNQNGEMHAYETYSKGFNDDFLSSDAEQREVAEKGIRFAELLGDTLVGDLKNNFVRADSEEGNIGYQISLQGQQIPSYINAGLDLMFSSARHSYGDFEPYSVDFEDYTILEDMTAGEQDDLYQQGYDLLDQKGGSGVVLVTKDRELKYFATWEEYGAYMGDNEENPDMNSLLDGEMLMENMGNDPSIESANCYVTFDDQGRILENRIDGTMTGYDDAGNKHSYTLTINLKFYDYGATKIAPVDMSQANVLNDEKQIDATEPAPEAITPETATSEAITPEAVMPKETPEG